MIAEVFSSLFSFLVYSAVGYALAFAIVAACAVLGRWAHHLAHPLRARRVQLGRLVSVPDHTRRERNALVIIAAVVIAATAAIADARPCGSERSAIKLGLDEEAKRLSTEPYDTTIDRLVNLPRPGRLPDDHRASDVERMVWRVDAVVVAYRAEDDGDIHVVVTDGTRTMIVEIPAEECMAPGAWGGEVREVRAAFLAMLADRGFPVPSKKVHRTRIPVRVGGVGFFDKEHGQSGAAKNGVELHPVLSIAVSGGAS